LGGFKVISTKSGLSRVKTQGFLQKKMDMLAKTAHVNTTCHSPILLLFNLADFQKGEDSRGGEKSSKTSEKRSQAELCHMECGK